MENRQLQTKRLLLRPISERDLEQIHALQCIPEVQEFNTTGIPENIKETNISLLYWLEEMNQNRKHVFAIELAENNEFIGIIGINLGKTNYRNAEVWFKFLPENWGKGYGTESLLCIVQFGFNALNLHRIEAGCAVGNIASYKLMEKVGMTREAHTRQLLPLPSGWSDNYGYAILSTDEYLID